MAIFVRTVRANHDETIEVQWRLADGSVYVERYTLPPKSVRDARETDRSALAALAAEIVARVDGQDGRPE